MGVVTVIGLLLVVVLVKLIQAYDSCSNVVEGYTYFNEGTDTKIVFGTDGAANITKAGE